MGIRECTPFRGVRPTGGSSLYSADHVEKLTESGIKFVTRVPETIGEAKTRIQEADIESMEPLTEGYRAEECRSDYGDAEQRWLVVYSEEAEERARKSVEEQVRREHEEEKKTFSKLTEREFACREDAEQALEEFESGLQASEFERKQVQRAPRYTLEESSSPDGEGNRLEETGDVEWLVRGTLVPPEARKARLLKRKSLFILATNELDEDTLPAEELLRGYKGQVRVERGFRFLKEPWFMASSIYLQDEKRIMALLMVMTLCLLVCIPLLNGASEMGFSPKIWRSLTRKGIRLSARRPGGCFRAFMGSTYYLTVVVRLF